VNFLLTATISAVWIHSKGLEALLDIHFPLNEEFFKWGSILECKYAELFNVRMNTKFLFAFAQVLSNVVVMLTRA
jgi:hypothetical protein